MKEINENTDPDELQNYLESLKGKETLSFDDLYSGRESQETDMETEKTEVPEQERESKKEPEVEEKAEAPKVQKEPVKGEKPPVEEDEVLKVVGKETVLKVKGKEYPLSDFSPDEIKAYLQKGLRFTQRMQELAEKEKELQEKEALVTRGADVVNRFLSQYGQQPAGGLQVKPEGAIPPELMPSEDDTYEVRAIKEATARIFQQNADLRRELDFLKGHIYAQGYSQAEKQLLQEIDSLMEDYPCASKDEVIALKALYPNIPTEKIVAKSHEHYSSKDWVERVLKANPELDRELYEKYSSKYLAKKQEVKNIPQKSSGGTVITRPVTEKRKQISSWDEAEAEAYRLMEAYRKSSDEENVE